MPDDLDTHLAQLAHESLARHTAAVDAVADRVALVDRLSDTRVRSSSSSSRWLAVAAAAVLVLAGVVGVAWAVGAEPTQIVAPPPDSATATTPRATPASPATSTPLVTERAVADPEQVLPGDSVTITPAAAVERACGDPVAAFATPAGAVDGQIFGGLWVPVGSDASIITTPCNPQTSSQPLTFAVPADMPPGDYELCLTRTRIEAGCALVTVLAAPLTTPPPMSATSDCATVPGAPPSLSDGSAPGQPTIALAPDGMSRLATWGQPGSATAVTQILDVAHDTSWLAAEPGVIASGRFRAAVSAGSLDADRTVHVVTFDEAERCVRSYLVDPALQNWDAQLLAHWWVEALAGVAPVPTGGTPLLGTDGYFAAAWGERAITVEYSSDGTMVGEVVSDEPPPDRVTQLQLPDGRRLELDLSGMNGRCTGGDLVVSSTGEPLHPQLVGLDSAGVSETGVVFATYDRCPTGHWGDAGSETVLVRFDPATDADPVAIDSMNPDPDVVWSDVQGVVYSGDGRPVASVSPDGGYLGVQDRFHLEKSRYEVRAAADPSVPMSLASACAQPGDIASIPAFVTDDVVVVARMCDGARTLHVEAIALGENRLLWSNSVDWLDADSYSSTAGLSARIGPDGGIVALVTAGGGTEQPNRAVVFTADAAAEITRLGFGRYVFELDEL